MAGPIITSFPVLFFVVISFLRTGLCQSWSVPIVVELLVRVHYKWRRGWPVALGAIKEFDPDVDRITPYLERVALFLTANGVGEDAEVPAFLSIIGGKA